MGAAMLVGLAAITATQIAYGAPTPNNCGMNMLCRIRTLIVSGTSTFGGGVTVSGTISAQTLDGGSIRGTTGNFSGPVVVSDTLSAQTLDGGSIRGTTLNLSDTLTGTRATFNETVSAQVLDAGTLRLYGGATISGTASVGVLDGGAIIGTTLNLSGAIKAASITLTTPVETGAWTAAWVGPLTEGLNGGGYIIDQPGGKLAKVVCTCAVAGTAGTNGVFMELYEDGIAAATVEVAAADADACDDAAGTVLTGTLDYAPTNATYSLQPKNTTDCAVNPSGCLCNVVVTR